MKLMMNSSFSLAFLLIFYLHSWRHSYAAAVCHSAIYSFGDSLADTGNWLASNPIAAAIVDKLPYGETYFKRGTGRFSDGRLVVDYIAQASGLPFLAPYLAGVTANTSGVNFAVAGATALEPAFFVKKLKLPPMTSFSLDKQILMFLKYRKKICSNSPDCKEHFANALFMVGEIGGNDYNNPFIQGRPMEEVETFVPLVINKTVRAMKTLITVGGARKILAQNNLPIGCSALYLRNYATGPGKEPLDAMGCMPRFNAFAKRGNDLLKTKVAHLQAQHPDVKFVFADNYNAVLRILQSPPLSGLGKNALNACCGAGGPYNYNPQMPCGVGVAVPCANPEQYLNWDGVHLTDAAYGQIAHLFWNGTFTSPPLHTLCGD